MIIKGLWTSMELLSGFELMLPRFRGFCSLYLCLQKTLVKRGTHKCVSYFIVMDSSKKEWVHASPEIPLYASILQLLRSSVVIRIYHHGPGEKMNTVVMVTLDTDPNDVCFTRREPFFYLSYSRSLILQITGLMKLFHGLCKYLNKNQLLFLLFFLPLPKNSHPFYFLCFYMK